MLTQISLILKSPSLLYSQDSIYVEVYQYALLFLERPCPCPIEFGHFPQRAHLLLCLQDTFPKEYKYYCARKIDNTLPKEYISYWFFPHRVFYAHEY